MSTSKYITGNFFSFGQKCQNRYFGRFQILKVPIQFAFAGTNNTPGGGTVKNTSGAIMQSKKRSELSTIHEVSSQREGKDTFKDKVNPYDSYKKSTI